MINLGFVGLGWWGNELGNAAQTLSSKINIHGCYSFSSIEMSKFSSKFETKVYKNYQEMLADPEIDGVVLATPHTQHADQVIQAAKTGKHVFVEKPLALTISDAKSAASYCNSNNVVLAVGHNRRFSASAQELSRWIKDKKLGQLLHVEAHFSGNSAIQFKKSNWRANQSESPVGSLVSIGLHMIDTIQWLLGPIDRLSCISKRQTLTIDIDDTTAVLFELKNGMTGTLGTSFATPQTSYLKIYGTKGVAETKDDFSTLNWKIGPELTEDTPLETLNTLVAEFQAFIDACESKSSYPVTPDEAVKNVSVIEAMNNSSRMNGEWIKIKMSN